MTVLQLKFVCWSDSAAKRDGRQTLGLRVKLDLAFVLIQDSFLQSTGKRHVMF